MNNKINYIVLGYPRSGTSLMMQILQAGGMEIVYDKSIDEERKKSINWGEPNYNPNPNGYFEFSNNLRIEDLPELMEKLKGKAIKTLSLYMIDHLPTGNYKIIFMLRDPEERSKSMAITYIKTHFLKLDKESDKEWYVKEKHPLLFNRSDIEVLFIRFSSLIFTPEEEIEKLSNFLEIQLDLDKSKAVINPNLYRFRK